MDIGIDEEKRKNVAQELKVFLGSSYTLYLQTHNFHWNVVGKQFRDLHLMFEAQYTDLAIAVDDIAERIRALGFAAPGTFGSLAKLSVITEKEDVVSAQEMVQILTQNNQKIVQFCRQALQVAQAAADESSASLISDRMRAHEKTAWMLRSLLVED